MINLQQAFYISKHALSGINRALQEKGIRMGFPAIHAKDIEEVASQPNKLTVEIEGKGSVRTGGEWSASFPMI